MLDNQWAGIYDGDIIVVDRSKEVRQRAIVIAYLDGEFTVKRIAKMNGNVYLVAEHEDFWASRLMVVPVAICFRLGLWSLE